jgi:thiol-disulfide isomerase/thioredoxin
MEMTRRQAIVTASSALAFAPAPAFPPPVIRKHPAFRPWDRAKNPISAPLDNAILSPTGGATSLRQWLEGRPTVLVLWATWCPPCLSECPAQAQMQQRLIASGARARIRAVQAYDDATFAQARATLEKIGASGLATARAQPDTERAYIKVFGASPKDPTRTSLPALLLLSPDGTILGRLIGTVETHGHSYWNDQGTFDMLKAMDSLV